MCAVRRLLWTSGPDNVSVVSEQLGWAVLLAAWGFWKSAGVSTRARNNCSSGVMTTCSSFCLIYGHMCSLITPGFVTGYSDDHPQATL